jgi:hypothetical protein
MKPIWYFVGLFLMIMGVLVLGNGIYDFLFPPEHTTVLAELHPGIWWGGVILAVGALYYWLNRKKTVE